MAKGLTWDDLNIGQPVGSGHSGTVFRATLRRNAYSLNAGDAVAVKTYKSWVTEEPGFVERLFAEVAVGRAVVHENVLRIHGALMSRDGRPALVMAFHDGTTLDDELKRRREVDEPFDFEDAMRILGAIAAGLAALHSGHIIHRDLKPANVLVGTSGTVIADFGVVKSASIPEQTTTGAFLGTIRYAAPEYLFGQPYDEACDVYSFGCLAYEVLTNRQVFGEQQHWAELVLRKRFDDPDLSMNTIENISSRLGILRTEFARQVISAAIDRDKHHRLNLATFLSAVAARAWEHSIQLTQDSIMYGPFYHDDAFGTAADAADQLLSRLRQHEFSAFRSMLKRSYWRGSIPFRESKLYRKLRRMGALTRANGETERWWKACEVAGSVREAFALGLLGGR